MFITLSILEVALLAYAVSFSSIVAYATLQPRIARRKETPMHTLTWYLHTEPEAEQLFHLRETYDCGIEYMTDGDEPTLQMSSTEEHRVDHISRLAIEKQFDLFGWAWMRADNDGHCFVA